MQKIIALILLVATVTSCSFIRKMDIEQGNILNQDMVSKIHPGMSPGEVEDIMGSPVLMNTFSDDRVDYVYTFKPGQGETQEKYVTLIFKNGRLQTISGNMYSAFIKG